jgi:hypothetical protein
VLLIKLLENGYPFNNTGISTIFNYISLSKTKRGFVFRTGVGFPDSTSLSLGLAF